MSQQGPFEIIAAPYNVYVAPVGETMADLDDANVASVGNWELLGTSGNLNYDEDGVTVTHEQEIEEFTPVGLTTPRKAFRTKEGLIVAFNLVDVTPATYAKVLNDATVTDTAAGAGTVGHQAIPLMQGPFVTQFAMIIRGTQSPVADAAASDLKVQYEIPIVYQNASPEVIYKKGTPAMLACEFRSLYDATSGWFGTYRAADAVATS